MLCSQCNFADYFKRLLFESCKACELTLSYVAETRPDEYDQSCTVQDQHACTQGGQGRDGGNDWSEQTVLQRKKKQR